jgi:hypothetical protein
MFCSTCGAALTKGLSYCNRCGAKTALSTSPLESNTSPPDKLPEIIFMLGVVSGAVIIGGFIFIFLLIEKLLDKALPPSAIMAFMMMSMAAVFAISWLLIRQFTRTLNIYLRTDEKEKSKQLEAQPSPQLEAPREPLSSVTEHTTRAFEPSLRERSGQQ